MLVLTRQGLPILDRSKLGGAEGVLKGAYVLSKEEGDVPDVALIASGSEVQLVLEGQEKLAAEGIRARVVSMPSWELFRDQPRDYRDEVLPPEVRARLAVEAGSPLGWRDWVSDAGDVLGLTKFGARAPYNEVFKHYGLTVDNVVARAKALLGR
jgi:transketolase